MGFLEILNTNLEEFSFLSERKITVFKYLKTSQLTSVNTVKPQFSTITNVIPVFFSPPITICAHVGMYIFLKFCHGFLIGFRFDPFKHPSIERNPL